VFERLRFRCPSHIAPLVRFLSQMNPVHTLTPALLRVLFPKQGWNSSAGIATRYGLDGPEVEFRWGRDFPHPSRPALGPTQPLIQWVPGLFPGVKRPGHGGDHPPHLVPKLKKEYSYTSTPPLGLLACSRVNFTLLFLEQR
jgi:hypothetical protein